MRMGAAGFAMWLLAAAMGGAACGGKVVGEPGSEDPGDVASAIEPVKGQTLVVRDAVAEIQVPKGAPESLVILLADAHDACAAVVAQQGASAAASTNGTKAIAISMELPFLAPGTYSLIQSNDSNVNAAFYTWGASCQAPAGTPLADRHAVVTITQLTPNVTGRIDFLDPEGRAVSLPFDAPRCVGVAASLLTGACTP
jgi:hypothetical protein